MYKLNIQHEAAATDVIFAVGNVQMEALQVDTATQRESRLHDCFPHLLRC